MSWCDRSVCSECGGIACELQQKIDELSAENAKLKSELKVKYQRCYCSRLASAESDNIRLKAALKPVLDFDFGKPRPGIVTCVHDATNAIVEAQRIYKEGESK